MLIRGLGLWLAVMVMLFLSVDSIATVVNARWTSRRSRRVITAICTPITIATIYSNRSLRAQSRGLVDIECFAIVIMAALFVATALMVRQPSIA